MSEANTTHLKPETLALSKILSAGINVDGKTGEVKLTDGLYTANLPSELTPEIVSAVSDFNSTFVAAAAHAFGTNAVAAATIKNSKDVFDTSIPLTGADKLNLGFVRSKTMPNPREPGTEITKYGVVSASLDIKAGRNGGQLKHARSEIMAAAAAALA
jgi:hypothetical protein